MLAARRGACSQERCLQPGEVLRDFGLKLGWSEKSASLFSFLFVLGRPPGEVLAILQERCLQLGEVFAILQERRLQLGGGACR